MRRFVGTSRDERRKMACGLNIARMVNDRFIHAPSRLSSATAVGGALAQRVRRHL